MNVCVCVYWCDEDDATWSLSSGQLAEREEGNEKEGDGGGA